MKYLNRKELARIAELEAQLAASERDRRDLAIALRELDQGIFKMAQMTSWESMRPLFAELCQLANVRMLAEHRRITNIMLPELNRTYNR